MAAFVLVHGAFAGGWVGNDVARDGDPRAPLPRAMLAHAIAVSAAPARLETPS